MKINKVIISKISKLALGLSLSFGCLAISNDAEAGRRNKRLHKKVKVKKQRLTKLKRKNKIIKKAIKYQAKQRYKKRHRRQVIRPLKRIFRHRRPKVIVRTRPIYRPVHTFWHTNYAYHSDLSVNAGISGPHFSIGFRIP